MSDDGNAGGVMSSERRPRGARGESLARARYYYAMASAMEPTALLRAVRQLERPTWELSAMASEEVRSALRASRPALINLLAFPPRRPEDRAKVQGHLVEVSVGPA